MAATPDEPSRPGIPTESENFRQTGARKLDLRPGEPAHLASGFGETGADLAKHASHLMQPTNENQEQTRSAEGQDPPGSFGTEADPRSDAIESSPDTATPRQSQRPD